MEADSYPRSIDAIVLPILAFFSILLVMPASYWHFKNRNIAATSLIFWVSLSNIFVFVNALIWPTDDVATWWDGHIFCDIQVKLQWAANVGSNGAICAIAMRLAKVMDVNRTSVIPTRSQRRRAATVDLILCFAAPILVMPLHYIVQPHRYFIETIGGCDATFDQSWLSIVLIFLWSPAFCLACAYYSILIFIRLVRYRRQFNDVISSYGSNMNKSRFQRLFFIVVTLLLISTPLQGYVLFRNVQIIEHGYSWSEVHGPGWDTVLYDPSGPHVQFDRWLKVAGGYLLFLGFGMGNDMQELYRGWMVSLGLGKFFPSLLAPRRPQGSSSTGSSNTWASRTANSVSSKAKLIFSRRDSRRELASSAQSSTPSRHDSVATLVPTPTSISPLYSPKKSFFSRLRPIDEPRGSADSLGASVAPPPIDPQPWRQYEMSSTASRGLFSYDGAADIETLPPTPAVFTDVWSERGADRIVCEESAEEGEGDNRVKVRVDVEQKSENEGRGATQETIGFPGGSC